MEQQYEYQVDVGWKAEKTGTATSAGLPDLEVATPPDFNGHEGIWAPEHLFVASVASCIMTTFLAIAETSRLSFKSYASSATGTLERVGKGYRFTKVEVTVNLVVEDESIVSRAEKLLEKAEQNCFISASVEAEVELTPTVTAG
jgi:organic hydroperoxide reductase OsmC/OhrA